jgi:hypothetical protein
MKKTTLVGVAAIVALVLSVLGGRSNSSPDWKHCSAGNTRNWVLCRPTSSYELPKTAD